MMLANSVAMFTIACSLFQLGFGGVPHSAIPVTSLPPIEMLNTTLSTIAPIIPDETSTIQTVESSTELLEKIRDIMGVKKDNVKNQAVNVSNDNAQVKQYFQLLKKNIELDLHAKFETLQSRVLELENDQNHQRNIIKEKDILISELSLGTLELSAKLYQSQEKLLNITEKYIELEKSYLTVQKKIETHNDELDNERKKHSVELLNSNTEIGQLKENNKKCTDQQGVMDKSLETAKSDLVKIKETLSMKSAELDDLKQKHSIELLNSSTEIRQLKEKNEKCMDQQGELENSLKTAKSDLVKIKETLSVKSAELENLKQKNSIDLLKLNTEVGKLKENNKKCTDQQEELKRNLETAKLNLVKNNETQSQALDSKSAELNDLKQKNSIELLNSNTEVGQLKEKNEKCTNQQGMLERNLKEIKETLSIKSAELENLKQKNSIDLLNLNTEIGQEKDKNKKYMVQQGILEKELKENKETLSIKSSELENLKQKNSIDLLKLNTEVVQEKDKNKKCMDQQGVLEKNLETTKLDLVKNKEALSIKTAELRNLEEKSTAGFKWVKYLGNHQVEPDMVEIGVDHDGLKLVIGRASHNGDILPAKVKPEHGVAYVSYNGVEYGKTDYEIMFQTHFDWVRVENGHVPSDAVPGGKTIDGKILYVGRTIHDKVYCAGKVDPKSNKLLIPYGGKEIEYTSYEVLVMH
ncbi:uveal autoantigen with coiled-coil domains and ankyrin repeats-like [Aphidius gifuensis]|uniref:uveal autoantigen with coiled-coil domains and ankyrin repeats-like n=1 Tax=Aphidius gifuensis TaxID=684658 RepID=UPI001CDC51E0|nr:uveal autoantigen with coiled-coil domains and ankyrin repeats-like [Aphidius gifuensis]